MQRWPSYWRKLVPVYCVIGPCWSEEASFIAASGVDYHDSRNSGLLGAPAYSVSIGIFAAAAIQARVAVLVWTKNRERTR